MFRQWLFSTIEVAELVTINKSGIKVEKNKKSMERYKMSNNLLPKMKKIQIQIETVKELRATVDKQRNLGNFVSP